MSNQGASLRSLRFRSAGCVPGCGATALRVRQRVEADACDAADRGVKDHGRVVFQRDTQPDHVRDVLRAGIEQLRKGAPTPKSGDDLGNVHSGMMDKMLVAPQVLFLPPRGTNRFECLGQKKLSILSGVKNPYYREVGARIRLAMRDIGLNTSTDLARILGEERSRTRNWLNGTSVPPLAMGLKLRELTNVTLDWLYLGDKSGLTMAKYLRLELLREGDEPVLVEADDAADAVTVPALEEARVAPKLAPVAPPRRQKA